MSDVLGALLASALAVALTQEAVPRHADAIELARTTIVRRFSLAPETIRVVEVVDATWKDSSLGCPERGVVYTPSIVQGVVVVLDAGQKGGRVRHRVHVGGGRAVVCHAPERSATRDLKLPPTDSASGLRMAEQARTALARRLGVDRTRIQIDVFRTTVWPDASLGCPVAGRRYGPQPTPGFTILLSCAGTVYEYHADMATVCSPSPRA